MSCMHGPLIRFMPIFEARSPCPVVYSRSASGYWTKLLVFNIGRSSQSSVKYKVKVAYFYKGNCDFGLGGLVSYCCISEQ